MLHLLPRQLPQLADLLADIGNPQARALALALGVSERTAYRWLADPDSAPRMVLAALFWLTSWGRQTVHCAAHNDAVLYASQARALTQELDATRADLARVLALASTGAANDATQRVRPLAPVYPIGSGRRR